MRKDKLWVGFILWQANCLELAFKDSLKEWMDPVTTSSSKKLREFEIVLEFLIEIYRFDNEKVRAYWVRHKRSTCNKLAVRENLLDEYGLYLRHFGNIVKDTTKETNTATHDGKHC